MRCADTIVVDGIGVGGQPHLTTWMEMLGDGLFVRECNAVGMLEDLRGEDG